MPVQPEPLLLDRYLPHYDVTEVDAVVIDADLNATWVAIRRADLGRSPVIRMLLDVRGLPVRLRRMLARGPAEPVRPPLTLDEMARAGFVLLEEVHGREIVLGQISRPWRVTDPADRAPTVEPGEFAGFDRARLRQDRLQHSAGALWQRANPGHDGDPDGDDGSGDGAPVQAVLDGDRPLQRADPTADAADGEVGCRTTRPSDESTGATTVTCTATDQYKNVATSTFTVTVTYS